MKRKREFHTSADGYFELGKNEDESLDDLIKAQKKAIKDGDIDNIVGLQDKIDMKKQELAFKAGKTASEDPDEDPEEESEDDNVDVQVVGTGYKLVEGNPEKALGPRLWMGRKSRDTELSVGDLSGTKQGEDLEEREKE